MPKPGQRSISVPEYIWEYAERYFKEHEEELKRKGIKSPTRLICIWIAEKAASEGIEV